jgi:DNA-nicking Smr family endonuclease
MKRIIPPEAPLSAPRRKRALSGEELELWESVAKQIKPLRKSRTAKISANIDTPAVVESKRLAVKKAPAPEKGNVTLPAPPPLVSLGRRERTKLSRGRTDIEARLDLHGMTQTRAHRALLNFLHTAQANGISFVLVITGKGHATAAESERGVLRRQVPQWLSLPEFRNLVVGFEEAHIGHGGAGALYVRMRRAR